MQHDLGRGRSTSEEYREHPPINADDGFGKCMADPAYAHASNPFGDVASTPPNCNPQKIAYTYPLLSETPRQAEQPQAHMSHPVTSDRLLDATLLTSRPESSIHPTDLRYSWTPVLNWNYQLPIYADHTTLTSSSSDARIDNRDYAPTHWNGNQPQGVVASSTSKAVCYATVDASQSSAWFARPSTSITATVSQATQHPFLTLNSLFYPQAAQMDRSYQEAPSTIPPQSGSTLEYYDSQNHFQGVPTTSRHVPQHEDQSYSSLSTEPAHYPMAYVSELDHGEHVCHQPLPGYFIVPFSPLLPVSSQLVYWSQHK